MAKKIIIADAGPLIAFSRIKSLSVIKNTLGSITISASVMHECTANTAQLGAQEIKEAIHAGVITMQEDPDMEQHSDLLEILGNGKATSIVLASELKADLLIDEKLGRKTAQKFNLRIIGTAGVMLLAKEKKIIENVKPIIQELKKSGYYLSNELINKTLTLAKE